MSNTKAILEVTNLQSYFFQQLSDLNKKSLCPVPEEIIYYSSGVMEKYGLSTKFFETKEGKVQSKILGIKLLEAQSEDRVSQKRLYKDVGDSALMLCGFFSNSIDTKILNINYYSKIGQIAYFKMNSLSPELLNIPKFYQMMASSFDSITSLISHYSEVNQKKSIEKILKSNDLDLLIRGITPNNEKKIS